tara:strand:- start:307 stop:993 length:687 start_codon:yes stop_codon:yes gene_type:complete
MTRDLTNILSYLEFDEVKPFFAVELLFQSGTEIGTDSDGNTIFSAPLYFWTGIGDTTIADITYVGTGTLMQISSIKETAEIQAAGATLTISGIPADLLSLALSVPYQGRIGKIKFGLIDADNNLLELESAFNMLAESGIDIGLESVDQSNVLVDMFVGYMDQMNINEGSETSTISLSLESKLLDLDRPVVRRYNNESQKAFFPNDKAFEFLNDLQSKDLSWGRASETT